MVTWRKWACMQQCKGPGVSHVVGYKALTHTPQGLLIGITSMPEGTHPTNPLCWRASTWSNALLESCREITASSFAPNKQSTGWTTSTCHISTAEHLRRAWLIICYVHHSAASVLSHSISQWVTHLNCRSQWSTTSAGASPDSLVTQIGKIGNVAYLVWYLWLFPGNH